MYSRVLNNLIKNKTGRGKAIIIVGPRQVGKTTLIKSLLEGQSYLFIDGDDPQIRTILSSPNTEEIRRIIGNNKMVFIDEAQRISNIGITMKIIIDQFNDVQVIASGSSSFDLSNQINEPLTGRKWEYELFPISWQEYENHNGFLHTSQQLENRLIYGFYPDVLNNPGDEREVLKNLTDSYLFKDILAFADIRKPELLDKLVQALALQVGNEVSYNELSQIVGVDKNTIAKYIDLLQKGYVIFKLGSYSKNLRNELKTNKKIYFYDNGIRNMVIGNFSPLALRQDVGALWENFLITERLKSNSYQQRMARVYFWRTKQQQEIDFVEEKDGQVYAFEFKWNEKKKATIPKKFIDAYQAEALVITRDNFRDFIS
jgi:uncharacterized protein